MSEAVNEVCEYCFACDVTHAEYLLDGCDNYDCAFKVPPPTQEETEEALALKLLINASLSKHNAAYLKPEPPQPQTLSELLAAAPPCSFSIQHAVMFPGTEQEQDITVVTMLGTKTPPNPAVLRHPYNADDVTNLLQKMLGAYI